MRLFLSAVIAILFLAEQPAGAQSRPGVGCVGHRFDFVRNGTTHVEAHTGAGQPCQFIFGRSGNNIEALQVVVRPQHGMLGAAEKEENRWPVAYAPRAGFVGHDRFEVFIRFTSPRRVGTFTTRLIVDMNITP